MTNRLTPFIPLTGIGGPLVLLAVCALFQWLQGQYPDAFLYDRTAIANGEYWRLLTGHLVHTNGAHLLLNAAGVVALWFVFGGSVLLGKRPAVAYLVLVVVLSLFISAGLWFWFPETTHYYGLSGVLHGLFCFGAVSDFSQRRWSGGLLLFGCWVKVAWEWYAGPSAATADMIEAEVAVSSHLLGSAWGTLCGLLVWGLSRAKSGEDPHVLRK